MPWLFTVRDRFSPDTYPEGWHGYLKFSGFHHIQELVSADSILCEDIITDLIDEDWNHIVRADNPTITLFTDFDYLVQRSGVDFRKHNLLGILERPTCEIEFLPLDFQFCGFDILDSADSISVLTNCGQHPEILNPKEVNQYGLLPELERANAIATQLRNAFPDEGHCNYCQVWAIARYTNVK
jgi:hypothetical protein